MTKQSAGKLPVLFARQKGLCAICRGPMCWVDGAANRATVDHKIPQSRGGKHGIGNLRAACAKCNGERGSEWWPGDQHKPKPPQVASIIAAAYQRHKGIADD